MSDELERWDPRHPELSVPARAEIMRIDNQEAVARARQEAEDRLRRNWTGLGVDHLYDTHEQIEARNARALQKIADTTKFNSPDEIESRQRLAGVTGLAMGMLQKFVYDHLERGNS